MTAFNYMLSMHLSFICVLSYSFVCSFLLFSAFFCVLFVFCHSASYLLSDLWTLSIYSPWLCSLSLFVTTFLHLLKMTAYPQWFLEIQKKRLNELMNVLRKSFQDVRTVSIQRQHIWYVQYSSIPSWQNITSEQIMISGWSYPDVTEHFLT